MGIRLVSPRHVSLARLLPSLSPSPLFLLSSSDQAGGSWRYGPPPQLHGRGRRAQGTQGTPGATQGGRRRGRGRRGECEGRVLRHRTRRDGRRGAGTGKRESLWLKCVCPEPCLTVFCVPLCDGWTVRGVVVVVAIAGMTARGGAADPCSSPSSSRTSTHTFMWILSHGKACRRTCVLIVCVLGFVCSKG